MKNPLLKRLYHFYITRRYPHVTFRGGWILTHFFYLDYLAHKTSYRAVAKCHLKGWSASDWNILGINDSNRKQYLSTLDYCSLHPLNGEYSAWIDDKLTIKHILSGTKAGDYMPAYYYLIQSQGRIIPLIDAPEQYAATPVKGVVNLLKSGGVIALKLIKGSLGQGFYKCEYQGETFYMNGQAHTETEFVRLVSSLEGYLVTEFLRPHPDIAKFCNRTVGCLRYVIGRRLDGSVIDIYSFMRLGTKQSKFVENYNAGGVLMVLNDGYYDGGNVLDMSSNRNRVIDQHPDNNIPLKGRIPLWDEVVEAAHTLTDVLPELCYMGIDFCITDDNRVKIIEINSLTSLDSIQTGESIFNTQGGIFFRERLNNQK